MRSLRDSLRAFLAPEGASDEAELRATALKGGLAPLCDATTGQLIEVRGRVRAVTFHPGPPLQLVAELTDGSGAIELIWMGRRRIRGIDPGRLLAASGRVTFHGGKPAIYHAKYELLAED